MRDLVVFTLFVGILPLCFLRPWVGLCTFNWLAYNRTQDLTWGFARTLPISQMVAIMTILGWLAMEFRPLRLRSWFAKAMVVLLLWTLASMVMTGLNWELQGRRFSDFFKVVFTCLLSAALIQDRRRLKVMMAVIALGLGFFSLKNGLLFCLGSKSIIGPGGMMKDNNDFGLALAMNAPLLWYLADEMRDLKHGERIRMVMKVAFWLNFLAIMSTGSRGAFLSVSVAVFMISMKTRYKVPAMVGVAVLGLLAATFAPQEYKDRISTIFQSAEEQDESVQGRFVSWKVAWNMIQRHPVEGIGLNQMVKKYNSYTDGVLNEHGGTEHYARVTHNTYLQIWAEVGTPAMLLFLFLLFGSILRLEVLARRWKRSGDLWIVPYCNAIQVSLITFSVGATFLNRSHFDLLYQYVAILTVMPVVVAAERVVEKRRRRSGPRVAEEVWVRHKDPFVRVGT